MLRIKQLLSLLFVFILLNACKKSDSTSGIAQLDITNVKYGADALQNMDVYLPANRSATTTNVLVMIHGGSWNAGDKTDFNTDIPNIRPSLGSEYAIFNINYRLANGTSILLQQQKDDITAAIVYIQSKAAEYNVNANKIGLMGASAGAHLALLKGYTANTNGNIKAVVDLFGPTDLTWMYNNHPVPAIAQPTLLNLMGTTPQLNATAYAQGSPLNYVTAAVPPTIIFHGTADPVVPISQSVSLNAALSTAAVPVGFVTYNGESHGWTGANLTDTYNKAIAFIKLYVR